MAKEIFGTIPSLEETKMMLIAEMNILVQSLKDKDQNMLAQMISRQKQVEQQINARPGSMALPQSKIKLFVEYNQKYINSIKNLMHQ